MHWSGMPDLLDANVWLSLSAPEHPRHARALRFWQTGGSGDYLLCRMTSQALLRLLTNPRVLGDRALDGDSAWRGLQSWLAHPHVRFGEEPAGLDEILGAWGSKLDIRGKDWTDAYLAAFATASGARLVSFDADFARYPGLSWLHLEA